MLFWLLPIIDNNGQPKKTREVINNKILKAGFLKIFLRYLTGNSIAVFRPSERV